MGDNGTNKHIQLYLKWANNKAVYHSLTANKNTPKIDLH